jgi:hypothetical protein
MRYLIRLSPSGTLAAIRCAKIKLHVSLSRQSPALFFSASSVLGARVLVAITVIVWPLTLDATAKRAIIRA